MTDYKPGMGRRIKEQRKKLGMTQEALAEQLGVSVKHLSETERGLTGLSIENLIRLCDLFGVSLDYLIRGENADETGERIVLPTDAIRPEKLDALRRLLRAGIDLAE